MSFDVFVQCFGETAQTGLPREHVRSLFPIVAAEPERWAVRYDDQNSSDIYVDEDAEPFTNFMVNRPCGDMRLWAALLAVLQMGQVLMLWPGSPPILARGANVVGLPEGMIDGLGEPIFVSEPEQFIELLKIS
jgi:hypothetical protein